MIANRKKLMERREKSTGHAVMSPSQLHRILACPASVVESLKVPPQPSSSYAIRGTLLHEMTELLFKYGPLALKDKVKSGIIEDFEEQYVLSCKDYFDEVIMAPLDGDPVEIGSEIKVDLGEWGMPEVWGTADKTAKCLSRNKVDVADWKFGSGVTVYAKDNPQALAYAAGVVGYPPPSLAPNLDITIHICQPPINHYDAWTISYQYLKEWVYDVLAPGIEAARSDNAEYNPGEEQCRFCPAAMKCKARVQAAMSKAEEVFAVFNNWKKGQATISELVAAYEKSKEITSYGTEIAKYLQVELMHGRPVPGMKLVAGRSNRNWADESVAENWLQLHSEIEDEKLYTKKFISPAQAEKLDRTLKKDPDFSALWVKEDGKAQLVGESDPRPALSPELEAEKVFASHAEG